VAELWVCSYFSSCLIKKRCSTADAVFWVSGGGVFSFAVVAFATVMVDALSSSLSLSVSINTSCVEEGMLRVETLRVMRAFLRQGAMVKEFAYSFCTVE